MKAVKWVNQDNPTSAADALEKSIAKWRFFSYCTVEQFNEYLCELDNGCGLCSYATDNDMGCSLCRFTTWSSKKGRWDCHSVYQKADDMATLYYEQQATLAQFHAAARKVAAKLRSLRN